MIRLTYTLLKWCNHGNPFWNANAVLSVKIGCFANAKLHFPVWVCCFFIKRSNLVSQSMYVWSWSTIALKTLSSTRGTNSALLRRSLNLSSSDTCKQHVEPNLKLSCYHYATSPYSTIKKIYTTLQKSSRSVTIKQIWTFADGHLLQFLEPNLPRPWSFWQNWAD